MTLYTPPCAMLLNDMHISKDNILEFAVNWDEALNVCSEHKIDLMIIGGDLFQSRSSQTLDVLLAVHDCLIRASKKGIKVILANGNHDKVDQEALRGYCHIYNQHNNVIVADEYITIGLEESWQFVLHLMAYFPENGSFENRLKGLVENALSANKKNFLYIHEGINGALAHSSEKELSPNIFTGFDKVFVGHYHNRCVIKNTNIEYIGSSRQHNFGEDDQKGYTLLYRDGSHKFIQNQANVRYQVVDIPVEKLDIHLLDYIDELKSENRYKIKVRVHTTSAKAGSVDKTKLLEAGANKVEIITNDTAVLESESSSLFEKFDNGHIQENYKNFCSEKSIDNVELGLSYLSKIN